MTNPDVSIDPVLPSSRLGPPLTGVDVVDEDEDLKLRAAAILRPSHELVEGNNADLACCSAGPELIFLHDASAISHLCEGAATVLVGLSNFSHFALLVLQGVSTNLCGLPFSLLHRVLPRLYRCVFIVYFSGNKE